jgi:hypothetical protein
VLALVTGLADAIDSPVLPPSSGTSARRQLEWLAANTGLALDSSVALCHYEPDAWATRCSA